MKKSKKTHQWLYNVGFIGDENGPAIIANSSKTSARGHISENSAPNQTVDFLLVPFSCAQLFPLEAQAVCVQSRSHELAFVKPAQH